MLDPTADLASEVARRLSLATGLPIAISDGRGKAIAMHPRGAEVRFCPLVLRDGDVAPPLPDRCETCPRVQALLAGDHERLVPCPHGVDGVRAVRANGETVAWIVTGLLPFDRARIVPGLERLLDLAALPIAEAITAERRERLGRALVRNRLTEARVRADRAILRLEAADGAAARREVEQLRQAIDMAFDALEALRLAPPAIAEVADQAVEEALS